MAYSMLLAGNAHEQEAGNGKRSKNRRNDPWSQREEAPSKHYTKNGDVLPKKVVEQPVVTPSKTIRVPKTDYENYIANINVVDRTYAKFAVTDMTGKTLLTFSGEFLYFKTKEDAIRVRDRLKKSFDFDSIAVHGPMASRGKAGNPIYC